MPTSMDAPGPGHDCKAGVVRIIDPDCDEDWPEDLAPGIRSYLCALAGDGPERLVTNARGVKGLLLRVGETVLPVLVSDGASGKASILSPLGHHVLYPVVEIGRHWSRAGRWALNAAVLPLKLVFRIGKLDRVVLVNHWLLSGAPTPDIPADIWPDLYADLAARHPNHALVVQDVKPDLDTDLHRALVQTGAIPIPTRRVAVFDPKRPLDGKRHKKTRYKHAYGRRLLAEAEADLIHQEAAKNQTETLARLYRRSNISRHSKLNPGYLPAFFDAALQSEAFSLQAWRAPGATGTEIAAFNLQSSDKRVIYWSTFGAETEANTYYERIASVDLAIARDRGLILDWGAGADEFKRLRGAVAHVQFEMVFVAHLPLHQRIAWHLLAWLRNIRHRQIARRNGSPL